MIIFFKYFKVVDWNNFKEWRRYFKELRVEVCLRSESYKDG